MSAEGPEKPKSPWGKGEEYERELGPEEVGRIRARVRKEAGEKEAGLGTFFRAILGAQDPDFVLPESNLRFESFRSYLTGVGGTFNKTYKITPEGYVQDGAYVPGTPDLLSDSRPSVKVNGRRHCTPEDLMRTAKQITEKFPEITFEFQESLTRDKITYTATLKKKPV